MGLRMGFYAVGAQGLETLEVQTIVGDLFVGVLQALDPGTVIALHILFI